MELYYNLIAVYSADKKLEEKAKNEIQALIDDEFLQEQEVIDISIKYDSVIIVEVEQDDGYCETIVSDNKGKIKERLVFNLDLYIEPKRKIEEVGLEEYFNKSQMKRIVSFAKEYEMTLEEFQQELLDEFFFDEYDKKKQGLAPKAVKFYK